MMATGPRPARCGFSAARPLVTEAGSGVCLARRSAAARGPEGDEGLLSGRMLGRGGEVGLGVTGVSLLLTSPLPCAPTFLSPPSPPLVFAATSSAMVLAALVVVTGCALRGAGSSGS